jgi:membrane protein DedA with SNARE-associated domain
MTVWLLLIVALIIQETATAAAAFSLATQHHIPIWLIHILWAAGTLFDMYIGYIVGQFVRERYHTSRVVARVNRFVEKIRQPLGQYGDRMVLTALATINFPYLNTFIAPWLGTTMKTSFIFTFIGNAIWYALLWLTILGTNTFLKGPASIFVVVGVVVVVFFVFERILKRRAHLS